MSTDSYGGGNYSPDNSSATGNNSQSAGGASSGGGTTSGGNTGSSAANNYSGNTSGGNTSGGYAGSSAANNYSGNASGGNTSGGYAGASAANNYSGNTSGGNTSGGYAGSSTGTNSSYSPNASSSPNQSNSPANSNPVPNIPSTLPGDEAGNGSDPMSPLQTKGPEGTGVAGQSYDPKTGVTSTGAYAGASTGSVTMKSYDGVNVTTSGPNVSAGIKVATTPNSFEFRAEAEANAGDSSVTFGDSSNNLRVGISDGAGMGVRYGETVNPDGSSTEHLGGDVGPFTGDVTVTHTKEQNEAFMKEMQNPTHFR